MSEHEYPDIEAILYDMGCLPPNYPVPSTLGQVNIGPWWVSLYTAKGYCYLEAMWHLED